MAIETVSQLLPRFWSTGAATADLGGARLAHRPGLEDEPTATFLHRLRPSGPADLAAVLDRAHRTTGAPCPRVFLDGGTPPWVEAALGVDGWRLDAMLQLVLPAGVDLDRPERRPATTAATTAAIRPARPDDWDELAALFRADHEEEDRRAGRPARDPARTAAVVAARRLLPEPVRYLVAVDDGIVGFVAAWPGEQGTGLVEDVFVRPDARRRGLATALVAAAVAHARAGGAGPVVIGADPDDTPKRLYARLGFEPVAVLRTATRP